MSELYTRYIKIARQNRIGEDISNVLSNVTSITVPWEDGSKVQYNVIGSSFTDNYYNYLVDYETTSSIYRSDPGIVENMNVNVTTEVSDDSNLAATYTYILTRGLGSISTNNDPLGGFEYGGNPNSSFGPYGIYKIKTYLQQDLRIIVSGSITLKSPSATGGFFPGDTYISVVKGPTPDLQLYSTTGFISGYGPSAGVVEIGDRAIWTPANSGTVNINIDTTISASEFNPGDYISLIARSTSFYNYSSFDINPGFQFIISSSYTNQTNLNLVLEPPFTTPFEGTNCDVLQGNATIPRPNKQLQDIDYSTSQIIPVNYEALKNYEATKASYPLSAFTQTSILSPEYTSTNEVSTFNSGSGFNAQSSVATNVIYYENSVLSGGGSGAPAGTFFNEFVVKYIITPEEELIEIVNDDLVRGMLEQTIVSFANPIPFFGEDNGFINIKGNSFSVSGSGTFELAFNGAPLITTGSQGETQLTILSRTAGAQLMPDIAGVGAIGGLLYSAGIENTSAADLPGKAKKLLAEKNII